MLYISDNVDPVVYSHAIKSRFKDVSIVIGCGDLPLDYYDYITSNLNKPLLFVFGDHNRARIGEYDRRYRRRNRKATGSGGRRAGCTSAAGW